MNGPISLLRCMILRIEDVSPYFARDVLLSIFELRPFSFIICFFFFFRSTLYSVYCFTGILDKYDDCAKWGDEMEPKDTSGVKKPKLKKSWVTSLYLSRAVLTTYSLRYKIFTVLPENSTENIPTGRNSLDCVIKKKKIDQRTSSTTCVYDLKFQSHSQVGQ